MTLEYEDVEISRTQYAYIFYFKLFTPTEGLLQIYIWCISEYYGRNYCSSTVVEHIETTAHVRGKESCC